MACAQNPTTNLSSAIPIRVTSRTKAHATLAYRDSRCASRRAAGTRRRHRCPRTHKPSIFIEGGGDDCGVFISVRVPDDANAPSCPVVDLHVPRGAKRGHDAGAMVRAVQDIPGWRGVAAI